MQMCCIFDVPDGVILGSEGPATVKCNALKSFISGEYEEVEFEGRIEPFEPVNLEDFNIRKSEVGDNSAIICKFNPETMDSASLELIKIYFQGEFPNIPVVFVVNDMELLIQNSEEAINLLNKMISHIQIMRK